ncbi:MAG: hypothetical protein J1F05_00725 [Muribaculaceae bacterium]|nr:hypothetical protein [Muribaculaceae bacterium]
MPIPRNSAKKSPQRTRRRRSVRKVSHRSAIAHWRVWFAIAVIAVVILSFVLIRSVSANDVRQCNEAEMAAAAESGKTAGEKVLETAPGSMQREEAIFEIRARETEIRAAGFPTAADAFAAAAEEVMRKGGVIE